MGIEAAIITAGVLAAAGTAVGGAMSAKGSKPSAPSVGTSAKSDLADAQKAAELNAQTAAANKRQAIARSRSVYTSPLGVQTQAQTAQKTLLGQ